MITTVKLINTSIISDRSFFCICVVRMKKKIKSFSHSVMYDSCNLMDCSPLAPLSVEFSRQEYWNGQPFPFPGDLPDPGVEPRSPELQADSLPSEP